MDHSYLNDDSNRYESDIDDPIHSIVEEDSYGKDIDSMLIDVIRSYPHIYDKSCIDYKDAQKKNTSWLEISSIINLSVPDCQQKWMRLREKFTRERKIRQVEERSGSAASSRTKFGLYDQMKFLDKFVRTRRTYTNVNNNGVHFPYTCPQSRKISQNVHSDATFLNRNSQSSPGIPLSSWPSTIVNKNIEVEKPLSSTIYDKSTVPFAKQFESTSSGNSRIVSTRQEPEDNSNKLKDNSSNLTIIFDSIREPNFQFPQHMIDCSEYDSTSSTNSPLFLHIPERDIPASLSPVSVNSQNSGFLTPHSQDTKKNKNKPTKVQGPDEVDKSFINLSSVLSQHLQNKENFDEENAFGCTVAYELRKMKEPRKTEIKRQIMKIIYEF